MLLVTCATKALATRPSFAVTVLDYILGVSIEDNAAFPQYSEAVKGLQHHCFMEAQRLAMTFSEHFLVNNSTAY